VSGERKLCTGCKFLSVGGGRGWCMEPLDGLRTVPVRDETTGIVRREWMPMKYGLGWRENTTERCRSAWMPCGPDALLWKPNLWRRMFGRSET
jgi:hypothetical protein